MDNTTKIIYENICKSMLGNIDDNFCTVSFEIIHNKINIRFCIFENNSKSEDHVYEIISEFEAMQDTNNLLGVVDITDNLIEPLSILVYAVDTEWRH